MSVSDDIANQIIAAREKLDKEQAEWSKRKQMSISDHYLRSYFQADSWLYNFIGRTEADDICSMARELLDAREKIRELEAKGDAYALNAISMVRQRDEQLYKLDNLLRWIVAIIDIIARDSNAMGGTWGALAHISRMLEVGSYDSQALANRNTTEFGRNEDK